MRRPFLPLLIALVVVGAACGARVSDDQVRSLGGDRPILGTERPAAAAGDDGTEDVKAPDGRPASDASPEATAPVAGRSAAASSIRNGSTDVGVTPDTVRLANVSTLSGPVPGLFKGATIGTLAAVAYQNSLGGVHGRRLELQAHDDQFDSAQNRAVTADLVDTVFAFVGSFAVYDDASAADVERSGIPDVTPALSGARRRIANNFNVAPAEEGGTQLAPFTYYTSKFPDEVKAVGTLWGDVPISRASQMANEAAGESLGWRFVYSRGYAATETDFTADVIRMRQLGVKLAFMAGSEPKTLARIARAMQQQNFKVPIVTMNIGYDHQLVPLAGDALEGMYTTMAWSLFAGEDAELPEVRLMNQWLEKVKPGYAPDLYALLGWASGRLLFEAMDQVGPALTRARVNEALRNLGTFDANQLLAPSNPGKKVPPTCIVITQLRGGKFSRVDSPPAGYRCDLGGYFRSR